MISPRILIAILCLTALSGCAACLPGQSKLDRGMVAKSEAAKAVPASERLTSR